MTPDEQLADLRECLADYVRDPHRQSELRAASEAQVLLTGTLRPRVWPSARTVLLWGRVGSKLLILVAVLWSALACPGFRGSWLGSVLAVAVAVMLLLGDAVVDIAQEPPPPPGFMRRVRAFVLRVICAGSQSRSDHDEGNDP